MFLVVVEAQLPSPDFLMQVCTSEYLNHKVYLHILLDSFVLCRNNTFFSGNISFCIFAFPILVVVYLLQTRMTKHTLKRSLVKYKQNCSKGYFFCVCVFFCNAFFCDTVKYYIIKPLFKIFCFMF